MRIRRSTKCFCDERFAPFFQLTHFATEEARVAEGICRSRALGYSLPVRSRKSAFGIFMRFDGRQCRSSGVMSL